MKTSKHLWMKRLAMGAAAVALPAAVMARGPAADAPAACAAAAPPHGAPSLPPPGMFPDAPPPGLMRPLSSLRGVDLSDAQEDKLFELMMAQAPVERAKAREAFKSMDELRRLAAADRFDADKARALAEIHAQALAQLALMHAELDAKVRALLTPEQRQQVDAARAKAEACRGEFSRFSRRGYDEMK